MWSSNDFIVSGRSDGHGPPAGLCLSQGQRWPAWWAWRGREHRAGQSQSQSSPLAFPTSFPTTPGPGPSIQGRGCYPKLRNVHSPLPSNTAGATIPGCVSEGPLLGTGEVVRPMVR